VECHLIIDALMENSHGDFASKFIFKGMVTQQKTKGLIPKQ
jgi:hypothetical protein